MPTYEYHCSCGNVFDKFQSINSKPEVKCEKCNKKVKRSISGGAGIHFKGSGFYVNDYKTKKK
jgi:putative FmdB family regulatory protein